MIEVKQIKIQLTGMLICLVITLASVVTAQEAQPYQYTPPNYRNTFNQERRGYTAYGGFRAPASLSPFHGESVKFPDGSLSPMSSVHGYNDQSKFIERRKKDMHQDDRTNEVSALVQHSVHSYNFFSLFHSLSNSTYKTTNAFKFFEYFLHFNLNYRDSSIVSWWIISICVHVAQAIFKYLCAL